MLQCAILHYADLVTAKLAHLNTAKALYDPKDEKEKRLLSVIARVIP
jgi:hypothetical protein